MATLRARSGLLLAVNLAVGLTACHPGVGVSAPVSGSPKASGPTSEHSGLAYEIARVIDSDLGLPLAIDVGRGRAFTVSERETLRYWDLTTGRMLAEYPEQGSFYTAELSGDRSLLALERDDGASVWRVADGAQVGSWETPVAAKRLSADGRLLATASPDGQVSVWATDSGELLGQWSGPSGYRLEFDHQGTRLLGVFRPRDGKCCHEQPAILWTVPEGRQLATFAEANLMLGPYVLAQGDDIEVWRAEDGQRWLTLQGRALGSTPDARFVVTHEGSLIRRYSLADRKLVNTIDLDPNVAWYDRALAPDGSLLALTTDENTQVWDLDAGKRRHVLDRAFGLEFSDDGSSLQMRRADHSIAVLDLDDGSLLETPLTGYLWPPDERTAYASTGRGIVRWSREDGRVSAPMAERLRLGGAWISASGERVVGWFGGGVQTWDADTGERLDRCDGLFEPGLARWLGEDRVLIDDAGAAFVLELATCERMHESETARDEYSHASMSLAPSPTGEGIAVATRSGLRLFTGEGVTAIPDTQFVTAVDWARDELFAVAGSDVIRVLTSDGRLIGGLGSGPLPEPGSVRLGNAGLGASSDAPAWAGLWHDVAFNGSRVAAVDNHALVLFDLHTGERHAALALELSCNCQAWVAFDPTGRWLTVSSTSFGELLSVRVYSIPDLALAWSHERFYEAGEGSPNSERGSAAVWHPRGLSLVVTMREDEYHPGPAFVVEPGTWKVEALELPANGWLGTPSFSADGRRLLIPQDDDRLFVLEGS